jgi:hypothetical protein
MCAQHACAYIGCTPERPQDCDASICNTGRNEIQKRKPGRYLTTVISARCTRCSLRRETRCTPYIYLAFADVWTAKSRVKIIPNISSVSNRLPPLRPSHNHEQSPDSVRYRSFKRNAFNTAQYDNSKLFENPIDPVVIRMRVVNSFTIYLHLIY